MKNTKTGFLEIGTWAKEKWRAMQNMYKAKRRCQMNIEFRLIRSDDSEMSEISYNFSCPFFLSPHKFQLKIGFAFKKIKWFGIKLTPFYTV